MTVEGASCYRNAPYRRIPPHDEYTPCGNGRIGNRQEFVMDG